MSEKSYVTHAELIEVVKVFNDGLNSLGNKMETAYRRESDQLRSDVRESLASGSRRVDGIEQRISKNEDRIDRLESDRDKSAGREKSEDDVRKSQERNSKRAMWVLGPLWGTVCTLFVTYIMSRFSAHN